MKKFVKWEIQTTLMNLIKCEWIIQTHLQRLYGDHEINKIIQDALVSHDRRAALHDCENNCKYS